MSAGTWVLTGLCIAGVLLALASAVPVVRLALRLRSRVDALQRARLFLSLESLELQRKHLQHVAEKAPPIVQRAQRALAQLRGSAHDAGYPQMRDALESAGTQVDALIETLR